MRVAAGVELFRFSDFMCLMVSAKATQLHQVIGVYLVNILLLLIALKKISVMHVIKLGFAPVSFPPG
jgi:hypothetical protein